MRVGILSRVRLLSESLSISICAHDCGIQVVTARTVAELASLAIDEPALDLALIDVVQTIDLDAIRDFHRDHPRLPLVAVGVRDHEADIIAHGNAGFSGYVGREDGVEQLCSAINDARAGRLNCTPEIAAAMMRALFRRNPAPAPSSSSSTPLTRRESEVATLVGRALSNKEIARQLRLSESTVKHHVHSILGKFGVVTRGQLMQNMREDLWIEESLTPVSRRN